MRYKEQIMWTFM